MKDKKVFFWVTKYLQIKKSSIIHFEYITSQKASTISSRSRFSTCNRISLIIPKASSHPACINNYQKLWRASKIDKTEKNVSDDENIFRCAWLWNRHCIKIFHLRNRFTSVSSPWLVYCSHFLLHLLTLLLALMLRFLCLRGSPPIWFLLICLVQCPQPSLKSVFKTLLRCWPDSSRKVLSTGTSLITIQTRNAFPLSF